MNVLELKLEADGFRFNTNERKSGQHYKWLMKMGRFIPTTQAQAREFVRMGCSLSVLNYEDVQYVEELLNRNGFVGNYKYTKSKRWVRLINSEDLRDALKNEYNV